MRRIPWARLAPALFVLAASLAALVLMGLAGLLPAQDPAPQPPTPLGLPGRWSSADELRANVSLDGVEGFWAAHWRVENGTPISRVPYAYVLPSPEIREALRQGEPVRVRLVVVDATREPGEAGLVLAPGRPEDVRPLHRWLGTGSGSERVEETTLPGGVTGDGWLYVSAGVRVRSIAIIR